EFLLTKWLVLAICLCAPMFALADTTLPGSGSSTVQLGTTGWNYTYDSSSQTITYSGTYCGCGWWLGGVDYSDYKGIEVVITTPTTDYIQLVVQYYEEDGTTTASTSSTGYVNGVGDSDTELTLSCNFDEEYASRVEQIYIMNGSTEDATITVVSAELTSKTEVASEETLDFTIYDIANWSSSETTPDEINVVSSSEANLTFYNSYKGLGFSNYYWDLSEYDAVEATYENLSGTSIQLVLQDGASWGSEGSGYASAESGTLEYVIANHSSLDYTKIADILIQSQGAGSVTITSIKFVKYESEDNGEDENGSTTSSYIQYADDESGNQDCLYLNGTQSNTSGIGTISAGDDETSATLVFTTVSSDTGSDMGWEYSASDEYLNVNGYNQMVVNYTVTPSESTWKSAYDVALVLVDSEGKGDTIQAHTATGILRWTVSSSKLDPTSIKLVKIKVFKACTIKVSSIQLIDSEEVTAETGLTHDLLYPSLSVWSGYDTSDGFAADTDISLDGNNCVIETKTQNVGCQWYFDDSGNVDEDEYWGVRLKVKTDGEYVVKVYIQYQQTASPWGWVNEVFAIEGTKDDTEQTLILPFIKSTDSQASDNYDDHTLVKINVMWGGVDTTDGSKITITEAKLLGANYFASEDNGGYTDRAIIVTSEHAAGYGTYYNSKAIITPLGMEAGSISGIKTATTDENDDSESPFVYELTPDYIYKNTSDTDVTAGSVIPAGTPIFIYGEVGAYDGSELTFTAFYAPESAEEGTKPTSNWLHGQDDKATSSDMTSITAKDNNDSEDNPIDYIYYKLSYQNENYDNLGFYWGVQGGGAFDMEKAHKCWLAIPQSEITKLNSDDEDEGDGTSKLFGGLSIGDGSDDADIDNNIDENVVGSDEGETTGITSVSTAAGSDAIYTIQGVRVGSMSQKGVYIVNGRKVINK
ncbi:MAG: hypothetical protein LUI08_02660, partial [Prevotella sp.]|nr:hypothetical protein [Prevotella sp.]